MKRLVAAICCGQLILAGVASAQQPVPARGDTRRDTIILGDVPATPEMWFYAQERQRNDDPRVAVRRNAEYDASQRQARLTAMRWFGYSNARPNVDPIPVLGDYSAGWTSNGYMPNQWSGTDGSNTTIIVPNVYPRYYWNR
ncbi:MAG TPA: hypothetical protein VFE24_12455 [Pirellulales bacterium]|jgi:hypothetical protein|nr:hypothetical protein [Pirellulales bacterium]